MIVIMIVIFIVIVIVKIRVIVIVIVGGQIEEQMSTIHPHMTVPTKAAQSSVCCTTLRITLMKSDEK